MAQLRTPERAPQISPGFSPGTEAVPANWPAWITGASAGQLTVGAFFANSFFADMVFENPKWDFHTLNFDSDVKFTDDKLASILNSTDPNLRPFKASGGKLIQYHGWGDAAIPAQQTARLLRKRAIGDGHERKTSIGCSWSRGCHTAEAASARMSSGTVVAVPQADAAHDVVMALDQWVVHDVAPDQIIATGFVDGNPAKGVAMTRPLCPYPQEAHYKGTGDTNSAASFACQGPARNAKK